MITHTKAKAIQQLADNQTNCAVVTTSGCTEYWVRDIDQPLVQWAETLAGAISESIVQGQTVSLSYLPLE